MGFLVCGSVAVCLVIKVILVHYRKCGKESKILTKSACDSAAQRQLLLMPLCTYRGEVGGLGAQLVVFPPRIGSLEALFTQNKIHQF